MNAGKIEEATPRPWRYAGTGKTMSEGYSQPFAIAEATGLNLIAGCFGDVAGGEKTAELNAALIVRAVNAHEGNIAALKEAEEYFDQRADISAKNENAPNEEMRLLGIIRTALKQSEVQP